MHESAALYQKYDRFSDEELVKILRHHEDYIPEVLQVVRKILQHRPISDQQVNRLLAGLAEEEQKAAHRARISLGLWEKIAFLCVPLIGAIYWTLTITENRELGFFTRARESGIFTVASLVLWAFIWYLLSLYVEYLKTHGIL
ncbi:MAG: hypothetical protein AAFR61_02115 [Bacteroidota bacterium]